MGGIRIAGVVVALIVGLIVAFSRKGDDGKEVLKDAKQMIRQVQGFHESPEYYERLVDRAHREVFSDAYSMGVGRRSRGTLDEEKYLTDLFARMIQIAQGENADHVAKNLKKLHDEIFEIEPEPEPAKKPK